MSTHNIPFSNIKKRKSRQIIPKFETKELFQRTQERVRNSRGKRAISVRATEVLLYVADSQSNYPYYWYGNALLFYMRTNRNSSFRIVNLMR